MEIWPRVCMPVLSRTGSRTHVCHLSNDKAKPELEYRDQQNLRDISRNIIMHKYFKGMVSPGKIMAN